MCGVRMSSRSKKGRDGGGLLKVRVWDAEALRMAWVSAASLRRLSQV